MEIFFYQDLRVAINLINTETAFVKNHLQILNNKASVTEQEKLNS